MSENLLSQSTRDVAAVRYFNCWRRDDEGSTEMPHPRDIGQALDAVCDHVERLEREIAKERDWHQQSKSAAMRVQQERSKLERELEQARQDAKQSDLDAIRALDRARMARAELARIKAILADPLAVHLNMMRGIIQWTPANLRHLLGDCQPTPADD